MSNFKTANAVPKNRRQGRLAKWLCIASAAVSTALVPSHLGAAQGNLQFGVGITTINACVVIVRRAGTLRANPEATQLSSKLAGGVTGVADVYSLFNYEITAQPPPFFTSMPEGGYTDITFTTTMQGQALTNRGRTFGERDGMDAVRLRNGYSGTRVFIHLTADRAAGFPVGAYESFVTMRCE